MPTVLHLVYQVEELDTKERDDMENTHMAFSKYQKEILIEALNCLIKQYEKDDREHDCVGDFYKLQEVLEK